MLSDAADFKASAQKCLPTATSPAARDRPLAVGYDDPTIISAAVLAREILEELGDLIHGRGRGGDAVRRQDRAAAVVASPGRDVESVLLQLHGDLLDRRPIGKEQMMDNPAAWRHRPVAVARPIEVNSDNSHRAVFPGRTAWSESSDRQVNPPLRLRRRDQFDRIAARNLLKDVIGFRATGST
jgi:hypothetical protein